MNVFVSSIQVNKRARNKRPYNGYFSYSVNNSSVNSGVGKTVIEFTGINNPQIADYETDYAPSYGQYPTIALFTIDGDNNRVERSENPYFVMGIDGKINSVNFGTLDGIYSGFITIGR